VQWQVCKLIVESLWLSTNFDDEGKIEGGLFGGKSLISGAFGRPLSDEHLLNRATDGLVKLRWYLAGKPRVLPSSNVLATSCPDRVTALQIKVVSCVRLGWAAKERDRRSRFVTSEPRLLMHKAVNSTTDKYIRCVYYACRCTGHCSY